MRTLIYKRTHHGDPDPAGRFGIHDCMGRVRTWSLEAVIGVGGIGADPESWSRCSGVLMRPRARRGSTFDRSNLVVELLAAVSSAGDTSFSSRGPKIRATMMIRLSVGSKRVTFTRTTGG
jgi:hypothetical protein